MTYHHRAWLTTTITIGALLLLVASGASGQPYAAQIQRALSTFLTTAHTWTATQTFGDVTVGGTCTGCGGGGAPTNAKYITQTADATLSAEQALGALATGLLLNTTTTGVLSAYGGSTCTNQAVTAISASGAATCTTLTSAYTTGLATTGANTFTGAQTIAAGTGSGTFKASGTVCQSLTNPTDASVQNQWNVISCTIPANTLNTVGDRLHIEVPSILGANSNSKEYQVYWALNSATCSGTSSTLCNSGCQLQNNANTGSGQQILTIANVLLTSAGNQKRWTSTINSSSVYAASVNTCTVDETQVTQVAAGWRNAAAAAASVQAGTIDVTYYPK